MWLIFARGQVSTALRRQNPRVDMIRLCGRWWKRRIAVILLMSEVTLGSASELAKPHARLSIYMAPMIGT